MMQKLTNENFLMYAIKHYDNPSCSGLKEFDDDLKRLRYIKRLLGRYKATGDIKERLVINHLVVLYNVFGVDATTNMLFFKIQERFWPELKTFLVFLNYMPEQLNLKGQLVKSADIALDQNIVELLRKI
jgi:5'(3')-deoxyribonucleotidase